jgi:pilus assembly protein FimV
MSPREDQILELTEIVEEGEPLAPSLGPGAGIEAELNDLFADFDGNRSTDAARKNENDDDIDFDAIFSEADEEPGGFTTEHGSETVNHGDGPEEGQEDGGLDLDSLFEDDTAVSGDSGSDQVEDSSGAQGFELDSLFDEEEEPEADPMAHALQPKGEQEIGLDDLFMEDEGIDEAQGFSEEKRTGAEPLELDDFFAEDTGATSRGNRTSIPEFDGTVEEIEDFDLSDLPEKGSSGGVEELMLELADENESDQTSEFLIEQDEFLPVTEGAGGGADLSELDALIAGLEGEEQAEEEGEGPAPKKQEFVLEIEQEFSLEEEGEPSQLPSDLLEAGFETEMIEKASPDSELVFERMLPRIEQEITQRVEERMAAVSADWTEREQNLLLAIDRMEKENESLRAMIEDLPESISKEELARFKQELKEELAAELKRSVPEEAANVIREEISALMKTLSEE